VSLGQPTGCGEKRAQIGKMGEWIQLHGRTFAFGAGAEKHGCSPPHLLLDTLITAVEALKEVAQHIGRLVTDAKSSKHHYSTSQATKCECSRVGLSLKLNIVRCNRWWQPHGADLTANYADRDPNFKSSLVKVRF
jgi:hypothetical protein